ncbi:hypothetical protein BOTBODRAFT_58775 [Botryobasidium botryosum FD-172 SS1]|uniref:RlpA-like protein double-psi beta-barrel domain-containing protein n=1 Tax=Botryobasidium botryosum (strain FD-172 SS1) TaxID=930990 RepID=A0A067MBQ8_BOTB1|nr:hypothetical protein BOTBODRAFT_58775 [Botryobasidium botryosum FD-172 SS1]
MYPRAFLLLAAFVASVNAVAVSPHAGRGVRHHVPRLQARANEARAAPDAAPFISAKRDNVNRTRPKRCNARNVIPAQPSAPPAAPDNSPPASPDNSPPASPDNSPPAPTPTPASPPKTHGHAQQSTTASSTSTDDPTPAVPAKPTATPTPASSPDASASGSGNGGLGLGVSVGVSVSVGGSAPAPTSSPSAPSSGGDILLPGVNNGQGTFYAPGLGACGITNAPTDLICAVSHLVFDAWPGATANPNENPICNRQLTATYQGKTTTCTVVDRCVGCAETDIDFTPTCFSQLADQALGRINISWQWVQQN